MPKDPTIPPTVLPSDTRTIPLHQEIASQAYRLWERYGQPAGRDLDIWLEAERQVLGVDTRVNQQATGPVAAASLSTALKAKGASTPDGSR